MKKKFVIIDGHAIIHRAYHALPPMHVKDGTIVNAVYGFSSMLLKVLEDLNPEYLAVSFDVAGGTFRDEIYEEYKATRVASDQDLYDQIPLCYDVVEAFDIPIYEKEGYEADDVIGTIAELMKKEKDLEIIIVTGDKDMLQLADEQVHIYLLRKGFSEYEMFGPQEVKDYFGFGPEHVTDYKALRGDTSDNIPGVKGIGDKGAKELIAAFGTIEEMYAHLDQMGEKGFKKGIITKLKEGKDDAAMSKELATIERHVPDLDFSLEKAKTHTHDADQLEALFKKFEFFSLLKRIPGYQGKGVEEKKAKKKEISVQKVTTRKEVDDLIKKMKKAKQVVVKEILSGDDVVTADIEGLLIGLDDTIFHLSFAGEKQHEILTLLVSKEMTLIGHDLKLFVKAMMRAGIGAIEANLFDVMIASYIVNSSTRAHDLRSLVMRELGGSLPEEQKQKSLFGQDVDALALGLAYLGDLQVHFVPQLEEVDTEGLFEKIEMALIPVLARMELHGIAVDAMALSSMSKDVSGRIEELTKAIHTEAGEEFNISSSTQLRDVLFEKMGLPTEGIKKGKTGYSTAASELEKLREYSPIIEMIEEYREIEKLRNTYIDVLPSLINKETGRIHTTFNQAVAATGRLSSSDPNLQNIPIRSEMGKKIRDAFVAEKGNVLIAADYSQIELRIVASLAEDETLIGIFERGEDVHAATAAVINDVPLAEVTPQMRYAAKAVNFGVLYGMGAFGLARGTGLSQWEAKDFIEKYYESFAGVKAYMDGVLEEARKTGYVETLFGRRRYIPELTSSNYQVRSSGERMAINMPIQGTQADLIKMAMIHIDTVLDHEEVRMLLQVHDELVFEVKKDRADEIATMVKKMMEQVTELKVPIQVEAHVGTSWGDLK